MNVLGVVGVPLLLFVFLLLLLFLLLLVSFPLELILFCIASTVTFAVDGWLGRYLVKVQAVVDWADRGQ